MNPTALLLADPSPNLRRLALLHLFRRPVDDPEVVELDAWRESDPPVAALLNLQQADGSWSGNYQLDAWGATAIQTTALALMRLGYLGFGAEHSAVRRGVEYLFSHQRADGAWPLPSQRERGEGMGVRREGYAMMPLQTALPLRGVASCGYATDPRAEKAYDWLLSQRLPDGAWPTGIALSGNLGYVAGYRRLAHSKGGCRSNTTGALICLALHPSRRSSPEARAALDLLLGRETREEYALGFDVARLTGSEEAHGFTTFYARFDLALLLDLLALIGAPLEDERVSDLVGFVRSLQGAFGLWEYRRRPQASRWLTFDLLRSLVRLSTDAEEWVSREPRTPFTPYPKKQRRF